MGVVRDMAVQDPKERSSRTDTRIFGDGLGSTGVAGWEIRCCGANLTTPPPLLFSLHWRQLTLASLGRSGSGSYLGHKLHLFSELAVKSGLFSRLF